MSKHEAALVAFVVAVVTAGFAGGCRACVDAQARQCEAIMAHGSPEARMLAQTSNGACAPIR